MIGVNLRQRSMWSHNVFSFAASQEDSVEVSTKRPKFDKQYVQESEQTLITCIKQTLFAKTIASGFGSIHFLLDVSEQPQYKEAILVYASLLEAENSRHYCSQVVDVGPVSVKEGETVLLSEYGETEVKLGQKDTHMKNLKA